MRAWSQSGPSRTGSQESSRTGSFASFRRPSLSRFSGIFANTLSAGLVEAQESAKAEAKALKAEAKAEADDAKAGKAATRHERAGYEPDATRWEVAQTIRLKIDPPSCFRYLLFAVVFTSCALSTRDARYGFWYQNMLTETMLRAEFVPRDTVVQRTFESIESVQDVWHFLQGPFLNSLYREVSYSGEPLHPRDHHRVLGVSRVVGKVRIQQVRVRSNGCNVQKQFGKPTSPAYIPHCYPEWTLGSSTIEQRPLLGYDPVAECEASLGCEASEAGAQESAQGGAAVLRPECEAQLRACNDSASHGSVRSYPYADAAATGLQPFEGWFGYYGGGGYFVDLPDTQAGVRTLLSRMEQDVFFDLGTRAMWADFTLFNANVKRFLVVRLLFERLEGGGVRATADSRSLHLLWYKGEDWLLQFLVELLLMLLLVLYVLREFYEMRKKGRSYFDSLWNWWDWSSVALVIAAAVCRYQQFRGMRAVELHLEAAMGTFANFRAVAVYADSELSITAVSACMIYIKVPPPSPSPPQTRTHHHHHHHLLAGLPTLTHPKQALHFLA